MCCTTGIDIRKLSQENEAEVLDFVIKYYSKEYYKPLCGVEGEDIDQYTVKRTKKKLNKGWPLGAFETETNKLVGVAFGTVEYKVDAIEIAKRVKIGHEVPPGLKSYVIFFSELEKELFDQLKTNQVFYIGLVCVHTDYRNMGISQSLRLSLIDKFLSSGCKYIVSIPSSVIVCHIYKKLGFTILKDILYSDCIDADTKTLIFPKTKYPYTKYQLVYKNIEDCRK